MARPGVYYVRAANPAEEYSLLVVRGADFDRELNNSMIWPQELGNDDQVMGFVDSDSSAGLMLQRSFPGPTYTGYIPPDPTLAVGPEQIVVLVNTELAIYDKATTNQLFRQNISSSNGFFGVVGATTSVFDPWVVFDDQSQRFFIVGIDVASTTRSNLYLAVSDDATPTRGSDWHKYQLDFTHHPEALRLGSLPHFPDYEKLGVSDDAVFISGNYYPIESGSGVYAGITALDKASLLSGGPAKVLYEDYFAGFSVFPLHQYDGGSTQYFVEDLDASQVRLHAVTNVLTNPQRQTFDLQVPTYQPPQDVPQLLGGEPADAIDSRFMTGFGDSGRRGLHTRLSIRQSATARPWCVGTKWRQTVFPPVCQGWCRTETWILVPRFTPGCPPSRWTDAAIWRLAFPWGGRNSTMVPASRDEWPRTHSAKRAAGDALARRPTELCAIGPVGPESLGRLQRSGGRPGR